MSISFVGAGPQAVGTGTSLVLALPAGVQAGDLLLAIVVDRTDLGGVYTFPSGWVQRATDYAAGGTPDTNIETWYKIAGASESNPTVTVNSGANGRVGQVAVYRGVDNASPFDIAAAQLGGDVSALLSWTPPNVTTVTPNALAISAVATSDDNALNHSAANGHTLRMSGDTYDASPAGFGMSVGLSDKLVASPGAAGMPTWNQTVNGSDRWRGISDALKEAGAPPPPPPPPPGQKVIRITIDGVVHEHLVSAIDLVEITGVS